MAQTYEVDIWGKIYQGMYKTEVERVKGRVRLEMNQNGDRACQTRKVSDSSDWKPNA